MFVWSQCVSHNPHIQAFCVECFVSFWLTTLHIKARSKIIFCNIKMLSSEKQFSRFHPTVISPMFCFNGFVLREKRELTRVASAGEEFINWILNLAVELLLSPMPPPPPPLNGMPRCTKVKNTFEENKKQFLYIPSSFLSAVPPGTNTIHFVSYS